MANASVPSSSTIAQLNSESQTFGANLVAGHLLIAHEDFANDKTDPVGWHSTAGDPVSLFKTAFDEYETTGLWPLLLSGLNDGSLERPWTDGELEPTATWLADTDAVDVAALLTEQWNSFAFEESDSDDAQALDEVSPFSQFPGLAVAAAVKQSVIWDVVSTLPYDGIGLFAVQRPADVPARIGWLGPLNHGLEGSALSAVLRSWEDRFGAVLVGLGFATMTLAVASPPTTTEDALRVAAEFCAFCPDSVFQGVGSLEALAADLKDNPTWMFWWD
jgi:Domain of unknown function (DUF4253)